MTTFKASNFSSQNTPPAVQSIGNILLIVAAVGGAIVSLPATIPALVVPVAVIQIGMWMTAAGSIGKIVTKFFGTDVPVK